MQWFWIIRSSYDRILGTSSFCVRCFFAILFHADIPHDIAQKLPTPAASVPQAPSPAAPSVSRLREVERPSLETLDRAAQMLALLQRDGRLIDFLTEDITLYPDEQLGAAVRTITKLAGRCSSVT